MLRSIGSVLIGYIAMFLVVFLGLTAAYVIVGADRAFRPGVYEVSALWVTISVVVGFAAALIGGWLALRVAGRASGPRFLAALIFVLGIALAVPALSSEADTPAPRTEAVGPMEAMQHAESPLVAVLLNPVIGALGVLMGGRALRGSRPAASPQISVAPERSA